MEKIKVGIPCPYNLRHGVTDIFTTGSKECMSCAHNSRTTKEGATHIKCDLKQIRERIMKDVERIRSVYMGQGIIKTPFFCNNVWDNYSDTKKEFWRTYEESDCLGHHSV